MSRWAPARGGLVASAQEHGQALARRVCGAAKSRGRAEIEVAIARVLEPALREAYEAGVREGSERTSHALRATVSRLVARAVEGIQIEGGACPHCVGGRTDYGECAECGGTGRYRG